MWPLCNEGVLNWKGGKMTGQAIEMFSSPNCRYCRHAKELLSGKGLGYVDYDVSADPKNREEFLRRLPRARTIPQIFIFGTHIGGYDDLVLIAESGKLDSLVGGSAST